MVFLGLLVDGVEGGCHTYLTKIKLDTVIPYVKKIQKIYESLNHVTKSLSSTDINILLLEIIKFCDIKKYRHRMHFDT